MTALLIARNVNEHRGAAENAETTQRMTARLQIFLFVLADLPRYVFSNDPCGRIVSGIGSRKREMAGTQSRSGPA